MRAAKLLIVDDDKDFVQILEFELTKQGYTIVKAYEAVQGLERVRLEKPDLIILDIKIPDMPGDQFMKNLAKSQNTTPVIVLSNYVESQSLKLNYQNLGAKAVLSKKEENSVLFDTIKKALKK